MEQLAADQGEEAKMMPNSMIKPLHKIIAEHKDVTKIVIQLNSIITQNKMEAQEVLDIFTKDSHLWDKVDIVHPDQLLGAITVIILPGVWLENIWVLLDIGEKIRIIY